MKTMAIRLDEQLHAQLAVLAQLSGGSIADVIRSSIEQHVESKRSDPGLAAQADSVLAEIDTEARQRRDAIATLFNEQKPASGDGSTPTKSSGGRSSRRGSG